MIISHRYKFVFIKTRKTAGTSIEVFLSQLCDKDDILTPIWPHVEPHCPRNYRGYSNPLFEMIENRGRGLKGTFLNFIKGIKFYSHIPAKAIKRRVPNQLWHDYLKFCVERNPWDKTLSHYYMINKWTGGNMSFEEYLAKGSFCINFPMYTDYRGELMVDKVIKYESLMPELTEIFNVLSIPFRGNLGVKAKSEYRTDTRNYVEVYSYEQMKIIEKAFSKEITIHGYIF